MSDMRHLLEKMNTFAGERVGQKPGDQVRGSEPMPRKGTKKHPYAGRLVGANESSDNLLKELTRVINSDPVKRDLFQQWQEFKLNEDDASQEVDVIMHRPVGVDDYNKIRFTHRYKDGREEPVPHGSYYHDKWYRAFTGNETPMTQELIKGLQSPVKPGKEFVPTEPDTVQDIKIPGQDKGRYRAPLPNWKETEPTISEWGAAGTAVGPGNDDADPVEIAAQRAQQVAGKRDQQNQIAGLIAQVNGARSELAGLNRQFPQGANPVEKTMSMQQMQGQKVALGRQIEDLMRQVAGLRGQA